MIDLNVVTRSNNRNWCGRDRGCAQPVTAKTALHYDRENRAFTKSQAARTVMSAWSGFEDEKQRMANKDTRLCPMSEEHSARSSALTPTTMFRLYSTLGVLLDFITFSWSVATSEKASIVHGRLGGCGTAAWRALALKCCGGLVCAQLVFRSSLLRKLERRGKCVQVCWLVGQAQSNFWILLVAGLHLLSS